MLSINYAEEMNQLDKLEESRRQLWYTVKQFAEASLEI